MPFTDALRRARARLAASCAAVVAACGPPPPAPAPPAAAGDSATARPPQPAPAASVPSAASAASAAATVSSPPTAAPPAAASAAGPAPASAAVPGAPAAISAAPRPHAARAPAAPPPRPPAPAGPATSWNEFRLQAARRMVQANPGRTYLSAAPDPLLAIPVLEIELEADGRVRRVSVLRQPRQAKDTVQIAIDAVRRAAPYGDVSRLPRPWKFVETFLFDDERRFKPRSLDDG